MLKTLGWKGFRDHFATIIFMEKDLFFVLSRVWDKEKIQSPHEESNLRPSDIHGGRNVISFVLSCHRSKICQKDSPHQNVFKLTLSQKSFYVFRKDRQCKFIFLLSPSLDLINIISVRALEAMKVAGKTLQGSQPTSPAAGSYLQPCIINHAVW